MAEEGGTSGGGGGGGDVIAATASISSGDDTVWTEVSSLLQSACEDLREGELIHGANFNLYAAMSAVEIMDPKMDSGVDNGRYFSVDEAIDNGAAPLPLSPDRTTDTKCTIDIMDHLLSCEATWHRGHSLAQTVFSCIYMLRLDRTSLHPLLHSYCRIIRVTCSAVISVVSDARTHEEEDLFIMTYGLLLKDEGDDRCLSILNAVEETICRQLRACKAPSSSKKKVLEDIEPLQTNFDMEEGFCRALLCRFRFRKHFYYVLTSMRKPQGRGMELARKHIASCLSELELIHKSSEFLSDECATHEKGIEDRTTASGRDPIGFDADLNNRFSVPTPPRAIKTLSWKKAVEYFEKLLRDLDIICSFSLDPLFENVLQFVAEFQKFQPDLVARAHLQLLLVQDGKLYGRDPIFSVICRDAALPEAAMNHDIQKNECVMQLGQLVINLLKIVCTNTAWQRRKLGKILQDWHGICGQLKLSFQNVIGETSSMPSSENIIGTLAKKIVGWVEGQTYWILSRFLVLGFELELYSPSEYCMIYWHLFLTYLKLTERAHVKAVTSNDCVKRKGKYKRDSSMDVARVDPVLLLHCHACLAEGLTMMLATLKNERKAFQILGPFNTEHERFIQHFELPLKAFLLDHFSYLQFQDFTRHASFTTLSASTLFKDVMSIAKELKNSFSNDPKKLDEVRRIQQVAEHNSVALNLICRVGAHDPSLKVSFEFNHHPYFAVAVVKRS